mmetsp:Transcript_7614/g.12957  ORF Transcript_7614/g.12957 Transcript_7614/m.12957 type:complete len:82 (+) Transcript_7614:40-285(+)
MSEILHKAHISHQLINSFVCLLLKAARAHRMRMLLSLHEVSDISTDLYASVSSRPKSHRPDALASYIHDGHKHAAISLKFK